MRAVQKLEHSPFKKCDYFDTTLHPESGWRVKIARVFAKHTILADLIWKTWNFWPGLSSEIKTFCFGLVWHQSALAWGGCGIIKTIVTQVPHFPLGLGSPTSLHLTGCTGFTRLLLWAVADLLLGRQGETTSCILIGSPWPALFLFLYFENTSSCSDHTQKVLLFLVWLFYLAIASVNSHPSLCSCLSFFFFLNL